MIRPSFPPLLAALLAASALPLAAQTKPEPPKAPPKAEPELKWDKTDLGPFQTGCFKINGQVTAKGIAIKVGGKDAPATVLFDPELLRVSAAWTGGFIKFPRGRGGLEGQIAAEGNVTFSTPYLPGWSAGDFTDDPRNLHQGHLPVDVAKYRGLYVNGDKVILSYTVGPAAVLELPEAEVKDGALILSRTFTLAAGPAVNLLLGVGDLLATLDGAPERKSSTPRAARPFCIFRPGSRR